MAQPKIIIIKKKGEVIDKNRAKRIRKLAKEWDNRPKTRKLSRRDKKRIEKERKESLRELSERFKKKKPKANKKAGFFGALKGAYRDARGKGSTKYGKRKKKRSKEGFGLSLGGYNL